MPTGFLYDDRFLDHDTGAGHPERSARLEVTIEHLRAQDWFGELQSVGARAAERQWVEAVHAGTLIDRAANACSSGAPYLDVADVVISEASYETALLAAGGAMALGDAVVSGDVTNAFQLSRPPGHHAEHDLALGFCLFNNIAVLARYLQREHGLSKILILDWDVHHGNGTQHTFEDDPSVMYVSTHQFPHYPGTGAYSETGTGRGRGATLNCPMPTGAGDHDYEDAFRTTILPAIDRFKPDAVLLSAGFDAHAADPLAGINLSTEFFGWMTQRMLEVAEKHCNNRLISMLEGGYDLRALPLCVAHHVDHLRAV